MTSIKVISLEFGVYKFRKLSNLAIPIASRITVIAGHNGVGKSTILALLAHPSGLTNRPAGSLDLTYTSENNTSYFDKTFQANFDEIVHKGQGLYRNFYKHDDHLKISKALQSSRFTLPWVVSYDNAAEICEMYQFRKGFAYDLNYTAQKRYVGNEIMFFHSKLVVPEDEIPQLRSAA